MHQRTGSVIADAISAEVEQHRNMSPARHFTLSSSTHTDRQHLVDALWQEMARPGPLWSTIRLVHEGRDLHPSAFMHAYLTDGLIVHSSSNARAIAKYLGAGATLIYNHLHESSGAVQRIQEILEYRLDAKVWIQAYLTKTNETAFGPHSDDHNFVIFQLLGSKIWEVESDSAENSHRILRAGDGIFLRSGTTHAVSGIGELSLHLTIAFDWLTPTTAQPGSALAEPELAAHTKSYRLGTLLPVAGDPSVLTPELGLRAADRVRPVIADHGGKVLLTCAAGQFRFDQRLRPLLELIVSGRETNVSELVETTALDATQVTQFVTFAVRNSILFCGVLTQEAIPTRG